MQDTVGVAVIGAGMAGRAHAYGYRSAQTVFGAGLAGVRLVAIADLNGEVAADTARRYGFERAETSWQAVAEASDIDVVSVVVANHLHREIVEELLARGKHVLCEKPLAPSTEDAVAMIKAAERSSALARVGFTFRFAPGVRAIAEMVRSGDLGAPLHFNGHYWADYGSDPKAPMAWRYRGGPGSGALADVGSHIADMAEFVCGPMASVGGANLTTRVATRPVPLGHVTGHQQTEVGDEVAAVENDDEANYSVRFASGATGAIAVSRVAFGHPNTPGFQLFCERGTVVFDARTPSEIWVADDRVSGENNGFRRVHLGPAHPLVGGGMPFDGASIGFGHNDSFVFQARAFLDEVQGRSELPACMPLDHGLHNLRIQQAVVEAAETGSTAEVAAASISAEVS
ncbi:Gfo/Idh/MocA family oxidoreductase [Saccharopolyspora erythraea]|uniref:Gfo/Idh/MocA family protein n=1 Tax=Saccharopolyspora erythraea TaxID=1836 RepID=UPI001BF07688|nr:Gfo/Idh/MocA family oxidoreductase [Saccharopolyspora erythraea]QUH02317.1 Gfo/Idh/MocA family oxidoreductase [Saccharopolyspora erythraea]